MNIKKGSWLRNMFDLLYQLKYSLLWIFCDPFENMDKLRALPTKPTNVCAHNI